jgi:hypothetical protein
MRRIVFPGFWVLIIAITAACSSTNDNRTISGRVCDGLRGFFNGFGDNGDCGRAEGTDVDYEPHPVTQSPTEWEEPGSPDYAGGRRRTVAAVPAGYQAPLVSTFNDGAEGWHIEGGAGSNPDYDPDGGSLGGHIASTAGGCRYWIAPPGFRGNRSAAFDQILTFDLNTTEAHSVKKLVVLEGGGLSIHVDGTYRPGPAWTNFCVALNETGNWFIKEKRATNSDIQRVLACLDQMKIRAGYTGGRSTSGIDNVVLHRGETRINGHEETRVESSFETDADGWAVAGPAFGRSGVLDIEKEGGNPGGCLASTGAGSRYMIAPPAFRGDFSGAYGGHLTFDLNATGAHSVKQLVYLEGAGSSLHYNGTYCPGKPWTHYCVRLDETEKWFNQHNKRAGRKEILDVLSRLGQLKIRSGFSSGKTTCGLDNVVLHHQGSTLPKPAGSLVSSTFDGGTDGWTVAGNRLGRRGILDHEVTGGNPEGYIASTAGDSRYVIAPSKYRGDFSAGFGQALSFDLMATQSHDVKRLVEIEGGGMSLYCNASYHPGNWTGYTVQLDESGKWFRSSDNNRATNREIRLVLSRLGLLKIRAGFTNGKTTCGLDNVKIGLME